MPTKKYKTYLEIIKPEVRWSSISISNSQNYTVIKAEQPSYEFYKFMHNLIGSPWGWHRRKRINDRNAMTKLVKNPKVEMLVFYNRGLPIGYSLVDMINAPVAELADFGFAPEYIGQGLGSYFLPQVLKRTFEQKINRIWLSTRNTNHHRVPNFYQKFGFKIYKKENIR